MHFFLVLIIPFLSFVLQSWPRFFNKYFGVDVWTRMIEADLVRKSHHRIPMEKIRDGFILEGYFNYPLIFPWLLSFIPKKTLFNIQGFIAPIFDVLQNVLVFIFAYQITGRFEVALIAQTIYATIPLIVLENSYLTPRSLGYLNFTLAFYPLLLYSLTPNPMYLLVGFFFTTLIFSTHKFAAQSLFFVSIFFMLIEKNPIYLLVFIAGLLTTIAVSKGYYFRVFQGHIGNIRFWIKNYNFRFTHQVRGLVTRRKKTDFVGQIYYLLGTFTPFTLIGTNLWLIFVFFLLAGKFLNFDFLPLPNLLYYKMVIWILFFYILSIFVLSFKFLIPIGEGQRYLEMAVVPTSILTSITFFSLLQTDFRILGIICFTLILLINLSLILFIQWKGIIGDKNRSLTRDMGRIFTFLNKLKPTPRIICIPHQIATLVLYNTHAQVLVDIESGTLQKIPDVFPVLKASVKELAKKYGLNILVLKKDYATMEELELSKKDLLFESEDTQIIKI